MPDSVVQNNSLIFATRKPNSVSPMRRWVRGARAASRHPGRAEPGRHLKVSAARRPQQRIGAMAVHAGRVPPRGDAGSQPREVAVPGRPHACIEPNRRCAAQRRPSLGLQAGKERIGEQVKWQIKTSVIKPTRRAERCEI